MRVHWIGGRISVRSVSEYLVDLAKIFLAVPATSAPSESIFRRAGVEDRDNRSRLGSETLRMSLIVICNSHLYEEDELVNDVTKHILDGQQLNSRKRSERPSSLSEQNQTDTDDRSSFASP